MSNYFSTFIEMIIWAFSLFLLLLCISWVGVQVLNQPCILDFNPAWSWHLILFYKYCWIWFANIVLGIFLLFMRIICTFLVFLSSFESEVMLPWFKQMGKYSVLFSEKLYLGLLFFLKCYYVVQQTICAIHNRLFKTEYNVVCNIV